MHVCLHVVVFSEVKRLMFVISGVLPVCSGGFVDRLLPSDVLLCYHPVSGHQANGGNPGCACVCVHACMLACVCVYVHGLYGRCVCMCDSWWRFVCVCVCECVYVCVHMHALHFVMYVCASW